MFKNKINILLFTLLAALIGVGAFLGIKVLGKQPVEIVDFSTMSETEISEWVSNNELTDKVEIQYEYDNEIEEGKVIYQSIKAGEKFDEGLVIIISKGPELFEIPLSSLTTKDEADKWLKDNKFTNIKYVEDETSDLEAGKVISISPLKAKLDEEITVKVSANGNITVPDFKTMGISDIKTWASDKNIKVEYEYVSSTEKKDTVLSQSISKGTSIDNKTVIKLTVSNGDNKKTATIPGNLLGMDPEKFLKQLKDLGFSNFVKDTKTYFSVTSKKGTIFSYDDGTFALDRKINYAISEGKYEYTKGDFDDKPLTTVNELVKELNARNAHLTLKTNSVKNSDHTKGNVYGCTSSFSSPNTTITCSLAGDGSSSNTAKIDKYGYLGKTEEYFVSELKKLGFTNLKKGDSIYSENYNMNTICYYLPDGEQKLDTQIVYKLSLGKYSFNAAEYNGKTVSEANSKISSENNKGAGIKLSYTNVDTKDYTANTLYDCGYSNNTVSCKLAAPTKEINNLQSSENLLAMFVPDSSETYDSMYTKVKNYFTGAGFTSVTINGVKGNEDDMPGLVFSISIGGKTSFNSGETFKATDAVVVQMCNGN